MPNAVTGTTGNDNLSGTSGDDVISGLEGDDSLNNSSGHDLLDGGPGYDTVFYGSASYTISEVNGAVVFTTGASVTTMVNVELIKAFPNGGPQYFVVHTLTGGDDTLTTDPALLNDTLTAHIVVAGAGNDIITSASQQDVLFGGDGDDTLYDTAFARLYGGAGNDTITGQLVFGDSGDDVLRAIVAGASLDGGDGIDTAIFAGTRDSYQITLPTTQNPYVLVKANNASIPVYLTNVERIQFSDTTVQLAAGDNNANTLYAPDQGGLVEGLDGDDLIFSGPGADNVDGGAGTDTLSYLYSLGPVSVQSRFGTAQVGNVVDTYTNVEVVVGSNFADTMVGFTNTDIFYGGAGDDVLNGGTPQFDTFTNTFSGFDRLYGDDGNDTLTGYGALYGGNGDDLLTSTYLLGSTSTAVAYGGAGNDTLTGGGTLYGDDGDDILIGGLGAHTFYGGAGVDTLIYQTQVGVTTGVTVDLSLTGPQATGAGTDTIQSIENLVGTRFADHLIGDAGDNTLAGGGGDDVLDGGAGNDTVSYAGSYASGPVNISLRVSGPQTGNGQDTLISIENIIGSDYGDTLAGDAGDNILDGGAGFDTVTYAAAVGPILVDLRLSGPQVSGDGQDTLKSIESIIGSNYDDVLIGSSGNDQLNGGLGSDTIYGLAGNDVLRDGGDASHRSFLYGGAGNDTYYVTSSYASGFEDLVYEGGTNPDLMAGIGDVDRIFVLGDFFWDYYSVGEQLIIQSLSGSLLVGGKDVIDKTITGGNYDDRIVTYGHNSTVDPGRGIDAIDFGPYDLDSSYDGHNTLVMKQGAGTDYLYNFHSGVDKVDLSDFHSGVDGAYILDHGIDAVANGVRYCYFYFGNTPASAPFAAVDNFVVFIGLSVADLSPDDFIT